MKTKSTILTILLGLSFLFMASGEHSTDEIPKYQLVQDFLIKYDLTEYAENIKNIRVNKVESPEEILGYVISFKSRSIKNAAISFFACKYIGFPVYLEMLGSEWFISPPLSHTYYENLLELVDLTADHSPELIISGFSDAQGNVREAFKIFSFSEQSGEGYSYVKPVEVLGRSILASNATLTEKSSIKVYKSSSISGMPSFDLIIEEKTRANSNTDNWASSIEKESYFIINDQACLRETHTGQFKSFTREEVFFNDINAWWEIGNKKYLTIPRNPIEHEKMKGAEFLHSYCNSRKDGYATTKYFPKSPGMVEVVLFQNVDKNINETYLYSIKPVH